MANKFDGDVRPLSNDPRYMGVVFTGLIDEAIQQAHDAPDHGLVEQPMYPRRINRDRWNLLEHLNLTDYYSSLNCTTRIRALMIEMAADRLAFAQEYWRNIVLTQFSPYSLEYAQQRWPENFRQ